MTPSPPTPVPPTPVPPPPLQPPAAMVAAKPPTLAYVFCLVGMAMLGVVAILTIQIELPNQDNSVLIAQVVGMLTPTAAALLTLIHNASAINGVHVLLNSRLTELLATTRQVALSQGRDQERANPQSAAVGADAPTADALPPSAEGTVEGTLIVRSGPHE